GATRREQAGCASAGRRLPQAVRAALPDPGDATQGRLLVQPAAGRQRLVREAGGGAGHLPRGIGGGGPGGTHTPGSRLTGTGKRTPTLAAACPAIRPASRTSTARRSVRGW